MRSTSYSHRTVQNGRLIPATSFDTLSVSMSRCAIVIGLCSVLWLLNPANFAPLQVLQQNGVTNYGFFSVQARGNHSLRFVAANARIDCSIVTIPNESFDFKSHVCLQMRNLLAHKKPLFWDSTDPAHTIHRILSWTLVVLKLWDLCRSKRFLLPYSGIQSLWKGSFLSILWPERLLWSLWQANVYLYPVWQVMSNTASLQQPNSLFYISDSPAINVYLTAICILGFSVLLNAASKYYSGVYLLRDLEGLVAVGFGYYRAIYQGRSSAPGLQWWKSSFLLHNVQRVPNVTAISMTWFLFLQALSQRSVTGLIAFVIANFLGYIVGDYQRTNTSSVASIEKLWLDFARGIERMFHW